MLIITENSRIKLSQHKFNPSLFYAEQFAICVNIIFPHIFHRCRQKKIILITARFQLAIAIFYSYIEHSTFHMAFFRREIPKISEGCYLKKIMRVSRKYATYLIPIYCLMHNVDE